MGPYKINNTTNNDLEFIYSLFEEAIAYQEERIIQSGMALIKIF